MPWVFPKSSQNWECPMELDIWHRCLWNCEFLEVQWNWLNFTALGHFCSRMNIRISICSNSRKQNAAFWNFSSIFQVRWQLLACNVGTTLHKQALQEAHFTEPFTLRDHRIWNHANSPKATSASTKGQVTTLEASAVAHQERGKVVCCRVVLCLLRLLWHDDAWQYHIFVYLL